MEQEHTNWIVERAKCDMATLWADVCHLLVENVKRMNDESTKRGWSLHSVPSKRDHHTTRYNGQNPESTCRWSYEDRTARVVFRMENPNWTAALTTRWDPATSQCRLVVCRSLDAKTDEFPHDELSKAVQYILEPFFFPKESPTAS